MLNDKNQFLNLSPFVIDKNAFDTKASLDKLLFFERYEVLLDAYSFKHAYKPNDLPLVIKDEEEFEVIREQFESFAKLFFKTTLGAQ